TAKTSPRLGQTIQSSDGACPPFRRERGHGRKIRAECFPVLAVTSQCHLPTPGSDPSRSAASPRPSGSPGRLLRRFVGLIPSVSRGNRAHSDRAEPRRCPPHSTR